MAFPEDPTSQPPPLPSATPSAPRSHEEQKASADLVTSSRERISAEVAKVVIGQKQPIEELLIALFSGGHCLLTGAPGLAKTLLVSTLSDILDLKFQRIQFTPDLMPADIMGTELLDESSGRRELVFRPGPVFANMVLADEINRTPPKTQAALLEAMQEKQVTAGGASRPLPAPFFVFATQNPIEMEGTYPLPEAQLDRFMFNVVIDYLGEDDEVAVVAQTTGAGADAVSQVLSGDDLIRCHEVVREVPVAEELVRYAVRLASASRPGENAPEFVKEQVSWGSGLRAAQNLVLGAKARALLRGRAHVTEEDVQTLANPVLRHRILLNYKAEAQGVAVEDVIAKLVDTVPGASMS